MNQLIRCINCDELFGRTDFDQWPEYEFVSEGSPEPITVVDKNDFQDFLRTHREHQLEELVMLEDSFVSEKAYYEPVKASYFKATNGKERFVVKKYRNKISEPLMYQLIHGDYFLKLIHLEVQAEEIIKQMRLEFKAVSLTSKQIESFIRVYQQVLNTIDIRTLERVSEESPHPLEIYFRMDELSLAYLLRNCRNIFEGEAYSEIEKFIHRHKDNSVLLLKGVHEIQLTEKVKPPKEIDQVQATLKEKATLERK